jgi:hypothetical protein
MSDSIQSKDPSREDATVKHKKHCTIDAICPALEFLIFFFLLAKVSSQKSYPIVGADLLLYGLHYNFLEFYQTLMDRHGVRMRIPTVLCIFSLY